MNVELWDLDKIIPYDKNPKHHQVEWIINSILVGLPEGLSDEEQRKYILEKLIDQPISVDENGVTIKGCGRLKAAYQLKLKQFPVVVRTDLTPEQVRLARIADNRSQEGGWDPELLHHEVSAVYADYPEMDFAEFGMTEDWLAGLDVEFDTLMMDIDNEEKDNIYSRKIEPPIYEITGENPPISALVDTTKADKLISAITQSELPDNEKTFMIRAAYRHDVFNFSKIAEYYAHSGSKTQEHMEASALIIIDIHRAIEDGYSQLAHEIEAQFREDYPNDES
jgi:hypothetical protein